MSGYQEPPNGDFVAYIEELQRQSAARMSAAADRPMAEAAPHRMAGAPTAAAHQTVSPVLNRQQADELLARLAQHAPGRRAGAIALIFGIVLLLASFVIIANIVVDLLYAVIDPRVRLA